MSATAHIEKIANAVLYEGFMLYPYRLSSVKNRHRWNFGVLYPEPFAHGNAERSTVCTQCLVQAEPGAAVTVRARFLQLVKDASVERDIVDSELNLEKLAETQRETIFSEAGVNGKIETKARELRDGVFQLTVQISNLGKFSGTDRDEALTQSLISTHVILSAQNARFVSLIEPPAEFHRDVVECRNEGLWPVLAGRDGAHVLAAPIILYDNPQIAPQSPGDLFDGTEIDEILTLRIQTLTDGEKTEMRMGDSRTRALLERSETLTREEMSRLHAPMQRAGVDFKAGDKVRLWPHGRADIMDIALAGKTATILSVEQDFEDRVHLCVTVDDDPGRDLGMEGKPGHRFFFSTEEVEPA